MIDGVGRSGTVSKVGGAKLRGDLNPGGGEIMCVDVGSEILVGVSSPRWLSTFVPKFNNLFKETPSLLWEVFVNKDEAFFPTSLSILLNIFSRFKVTLPDC